MPEPTGARAPVSPRRARASARRAAASGGRRPRGTNARQRARPRSRPCRVRARRAGARDDQDPGGHPPGPAQEGRAAALLHHRLTRRLRAVPEGAAADQHADRAGPAGRGGRPAQPRRDRADPGPRAERGLHLQRADRARGRRAVGPPGPGRVRGRAWPPGSPCWTTPTRRTGARSARSTRPTASSSSPGRPGPRSTTPSPSTSRPPGTTAGPSSARRRAPCAPTRCTGTSTSGTPTASRSPGVRGTTPDGDDRHPLGRPGRPARPGQPRAGPALAGRVRLRLPRAGRPARRPRPRLRAAGRCGRPAGAVHGPRGSFLVFRRLAQKVPEFDASVRALAKQTSGAGHGVGRAARRPAGRALEERRAAGAEPGQGRPVARRGDPAGERLRVRRRPGGRALPVGRARAQGVPARRRPAQHHADRRSRSRTPRPSRRRTG